LIPATGGITGAAAMTICSVCGNKADSNRAECPFCGTEIEPAPSAAKPADVSHRIVNIEHGRPLVETALKRMDQELARARAESVRVVTLIHGYGSSGKGGKIRTECRKVLDHLVQRNSINMMIPGESFRKRSGPGKALLKRYPELERSCALDFSNPGITIVVIR
jgi:hypothetical protein